MTTDHKKQVAALFTAAAEGKEIQWRHNFNWVPADPFSSESYFNVNQHPECYRIAPEPPRFVPWDFLTAPLVLRVKAKAKGDLFAVAELCPDGFHLRNTRTSWGHESFQGLFDNWTQTDGEPCGRLEIQP